MQNRREWEIRGKEIVAAMVERAREDAERSQEKASSYAAMVQRAQEDAEHSRERASSFKVLERVVL